MHDFDNADPCEQLGSFLYAYADGELDAGVASKLAEHVASCVHCSDLVDAEMHVRDLMRKCYERRAPDSLRARVVASVKVTHIRQEWV